MPRPTRGPKGFLPVRGCHPLWPDVPVGSGSYLSATGLVRVRSPLLAESRLMSFPPGTEMFQFPGFASAAYGFSGGSPLREGLPHSEILGSKPARGSPRLIAACHVLHRLLAPRHPPDALAFLDPHQRQPQPHACGCDGRRRKTVPATTYKVGPPASDRAGGPHTHANDVLARRRKRPQRRAKTSTCRCPPPGTPDSRLSCRRSGHLVTTSRCPRNTPKATARRAVWANGVMSASGGRVRARATRTGGSRKEPAGLGGPGPT